jgi:coenzyme F420-0:L-glutamate ligase / coenzyme F420-1:gamma-L-glutamate ligase
MPICMVDLPEEALQGFLRSRRSVRRFLPQPVPPAVLDEILETASWAPSAHNRQPWRFVVLTTILARQRLARMMGAKFKQDLTAEGLALAEVQAQVDRSYNRIVEAPVAVLLCLDPSDLDVYPDERRSQAEYQMAVQSVALAGGQILLAAHAAGLGGVWVCAPLFAPQEVRMAFDLPPEWDPQGMVLLGYPEIIPPSRARRPLAEVAQFY